MAKKLWLRYAVAAVALAAFAVAYITYDDWRFALPSSFVAAGPTFERAARHVDASAAPLRKKEKHGVVKPPHAGNLAATEAAAHLHPARLAAPAAAAAPPPAAAASTESDDKFREGTDAVQQARQTSLAAVAAAAPAAAASTESDAAFRERMDALQQARQARLRAACKNETNLRTGQMGTVFNIKSLNLTYCCIAKCASTTFKSFLDRVTDRRCSGRDVHQCTQSIFPRAASRHDFMSKSLLIIRDPWVRLVSSYVNKFLYDPGSVARPCYKRHGKAPQGRSRLTFVEYIECIIHSLDEGLPLNAHVAPISWHCSPCSNGFTYIATLETFKDDMKYLILFVLPKTKSPAEYWKAAELGTFIPHKAERANRTDPYEAYYRSLSSQQMNRIVAAYKTDAILYGYPLHPLISAASQH